MSRARDKANSTVSNFASTGIDDNADATAITIDSSENVLVGTTTNGTTADGTVIRSSAETLMTRSNGAPLLVNRRGSDGAAIEVRNDNAVVGYINANASGMGVYLGGTAAANHLDDYEIGSFTPSFDNTVGNGPTVTYTYQIGRYTKVGNRVHWTARISWSAFSMNGSGYALLAGFPFTADSTTAFSQGSNTFGYASGIGGSDGLSGLYIDPGANKFYMTTSANPTAELLGSNIGSAGAFYCGGSVQV